MCWLLSKFSGRVVVTSYYRYYSLQVYFGADFDGTVNALIFHELVELGVTRSLSQHELWCKFSFCKDLAPLGPRS